MECAESLFKAGQPSWWDWPLESRRRALPCLPVSQVLCDSDLGSFYCASQNTAESYLSSSELKLVEVAHILKQEGPLAEVEACRISSCKNLDVCRWSGKEVQLSPEEKEESRILLLTPGKRLPAWPPWLPAGTWHSNE